MSPWPLLSLLLITALVPPAAAAEPPPANPPAPLAIERALDELKSGDWILQSSALRRLAAWKVREAVPSVKAVLSGDKRPWMQGRALVALAEILGEQELDEARGYSTNQAPELRAAAAEALGVIGSPRGEKAIVERLADPVPAVRHQAVVAFARLKKEAAWAALAPRLDDQDPAMVGCAAQALVYVNTAASRKRLTELLAHADGGVRLEAAVSLGKLSAPEAIPALLRGMARDGSQDVRAACKKALASFDSETLAEPLLAALRSDEADLYPTALGILALSPTPEVSEEVASLTRRPAERYTRVLPEIFDLLASVDPERYHDVFVQFLGHAEPEARRRAVGSLARCKKVDHFSLLRESLLDPAGQVRAAAFHALRQATKGAPPEGIVEYLARPLRSSDRETYRAAIELMRLRIAPAEVPKALSVLDRFLGGADKDERELAAKALEKASNDEAKSRIASAQGYIADWMLIGPFPNNHENRGFATVYPPEYEIDFAKRYDNQIFGYGAAFNVVDAACGRVPKRSLYLLPPSHRGAGGKTIVAFPLELPAREDIRLTMSIGLQDDAALGNGVRFEVGVDKKPLFAAKVPKPQGWQPVEVSLADYAAKKIALEIAVDALGNARNDKAVVGEPRIVAGNETLADLLALAPTALARVTLPGKPTSVSWGSWRVNRVDGAVLLNEIFPLPTNYQVAYGLVDLESPEDQKASLWIEADDSFILWLNGIRVAERGSTGEHKVDVSFKKGPNRLLIKVCNMQEWWRFRIRIADAGGRRVDSLRKAGK